MTTPDDRTVEHLDNEHRYVHIDPARTIPLDRDGMHGYDLGTTIRADGTTDLLLICRAVIDHDTYTPPSCAHEQLGPLPPRLRDRIALAPIRCGQPTTNGQPCRTITNSGPCHHHTRSER